jgi:hypothetical protein
LLINNKRSFGGGALLDHCIVKIKESKGARVYFQAHNFQQPICEVKASTEPGYTHSLYINGELYSNHKSEKAFSFTFISIFFMFIFIIGLIQYAQ